MKHLVPQIVPWNGLCNFASTSHVALYSAAVSPKSPLLQPKYPLIGGRCIQKLPEQYVSISIMHNTRVVDIFILVMSINRIVMLEDSFKHLHLASWPGAHT